ncbi:hypothetical protein SAMN05444955_101287 [Lihuaxuella thermophila]|uniref:Uncharacterized protein n=1 Tax=Lihuaxuella thermophila TaxID=1173111 RepID=A0A1H8APS8_9BACL|nr:hypothetical protein SAMN05444955_101287 [Lihuaxuella thermophila]
MYADLLEDQVVAIEYGKLYFVICCLFLHPYFLVKVYAISIICAMIIV